MNNDKSICELYLEGNSLSQIARDLNSNRSRVKKILLQNNITIDSNKRFRKYQINCDYFENIDSEDKAYWLGFIAGDGNVRHGQLRICLHNRDKDHLIKLSKHISNNSVPVISYDKATNYGTFKAAYVEFFSIKLVNDLSKYGIIPNKTKTLKPPALSNKYMKHYIRGHWDADGTMSFNSRNKTPLVEFLGTYDIVNTFYSILKKETNIQHALNIRVKPNYTFLYVVSFGSVKDTNVLYEYFYNDSYTYLDRKKDKFDKLLNTSETTTVHPTYETNVTNDIEVTYTDKI